MTSCMRLALFFDFHFLIMKNSVRQFGATTLIYAKVPAILLSFGFELLVQMSIHQKKGNEVLVLLRI